VIRQAAEPVRTIFHWQTADRKNSQFFNRIVHRRLLVKVHTIFHTCTAPRGLFAVKVWRGVTAENFERIRSPKLWNFCTCTCNTKVQIHLVRLVLVGYLLLRVITATVYCVVAANAITTGTYAVSCTRVVHILFNRQTRTIRVWKRAYLILAIISANTGRLSKFFTITKPAWNCNKVIIKIAHFTSNESLPTMWNMNASRIACPAHCGSVTERRTR